MAYSLYIIYSLRYLLKVPDGEKYKLTDDAKRMAWFANFYYLSPMFILCQGYSLKDRVEDMYHIDRRKNGHRCGYLPVNVLVALICDELFIAATIISSVILMQMLWLPGVQANAYTEGYDKLDTNPMANACFYNVYQMCMPCNEMVHYVNNGDNNYTFEIWPMHKCNDVQAVYCPMANETDYNLIVDALVHWRNSFIDPHSFVNETYLTYVRFGKPNLGGEWGIYICNQMVQGEYSMYMATKDWKFNFNAIIAGEFMFYIVVNCILLLYEMTRGERKDEERALLN